MSATEYNNQYTKRQNFPEYISAMILLAKVDDLKNGEIRSLYPENPVMVKDIYKWDGVLKRVEPNENDIGIDRQRCMFVYVKGVWRPFREPRRATASYNPFSIDNIIAYMERTKDEDWATDVVRSGQKNCFFGHLFNFGGGMLWDLFEEAYATTFMIYPVNDGGNPAYQQPTAKERVIAYLKDLRDGKAQTTQDIMREEYEASCNEQIETSNASRERRQEVMRQAKERQAAVLAVATGKQHIQPTQEKDGKLPV